ncbi:Pimeloyl-ACP methyl ester carboxylesterase [Sphingomonas guangdongensis]|uniref:Pimeloyl-ACP methyl ester carboxylesterase n=1 Tax=Sphingomonas guangdongensis TaxID=1141890 RepID=A0A285R0T4_9SPHN|nr:alpha/beta hydrolase [Sphingomonas guangdongensis]SOB87726.1 Pimeloyl-ACP methyl ester carboxylesterase [Sphingomonas guangdongensis]
MPYVKTRDGTDLYVKDWGSGPPVILIHGWPLSADSWDAQALALAENGFRAIAYDRRGFGRSGQPWSGYDYDTLADDLADVMKATGATSDVTLVGFSMGGGEVARYMSRHGGEGVASAVLVASVVPYMLKTDDHPEGVPETQFEQIADGIKQDRAKFFRHTFFPQFYGVGYISSPVSDDVLDQSTTTALLAGLHPTLAAAQAFGHTDFRSDLAHFNVPTLIIHGTKDQTVPIDATARLAAKGISRSQLIEYDGEPHGLNVTASDRLTKDLLTFLGR